MVVSYILQLIASYIAMWNEAHLGMCLDYQVTSNVMDHGILSSVIAQLCDWLRENPPLRRKDKYLEICNSIIQCLISRKRLKLYAYNSLQIYSYLIDKATHCTMHSQLFSRHFRLFLSTPQALIQGQWVQPQRGGLQHRFYIHTTVYKIYGYSEAQ